MTDERRIDAIKISDRYRIDFGDIDQLADSLENFGMLHPVVITPNDELIAGARRIEAARLLGWETVPVTVVDRLEDAADMLEAQRDENELRKDLTPTEAASLRRALADILRPLAEERMKAGVEQPYPNLGEGRHDRETVRIAARGTGYSATTLDKVDVVSKIADDASQPEQVRNRALGALAQMDLTGKVDGPYKKALAARDAAKSPSKPPKPQPNTFSTRFYSHLSQVQHHALELEILTKKNEFAEHRDEVCREHRDGLVWAQEVIARVLAQLSTEQGELFGEPEVTQLDPWDES